MSPVIRIDDEVMEALKKKAVDLGLVFESPNATLRYILGIDAKEESTEPIENAAAAPAEPAPAETVDANPAVEPKSGISFGTADPAPTPAPEIIEANPAKEPKSGISFGSAPAPAPARYQEKVTASPAAEAKSGISFGFSAPTPTPPAPIPEKVTANPASKPQSRISFAPTEPPLIKDTVTGKTYPSKLATGQDFKEEFPNSYGEFLWYAAIRKYPHRFENIDTGESY